MKRFTVRNVDSKFVAYYISKNGVKETDLETLSGRYEETIIGVYAEIIGESFF